MDAKLLARDARRAFRVEDAATSPAVVLAPEGSEGRATKEALFAGLIGHPEFFTQHLLSHPL